MIRVRSDLHSCPHTPGTFFINLSEGWGEGYFNVSISYTCENQHQAAKELSRAFLSIALDVDNTRKVSNAFSCIARHNLLL